MQMQRELDADIAMVFDECTPYPGDRGRGARLDGAVAALGRAQPRASSTRLQNPQCAVRHRAGRHVSPACASESLGRAAKHRLRRLRDRRPGGRRAEGGARCAMLDAIAPRLPADRPRYLMGVGTPGGPRRGRAARHRHVRLRDADPARAQRPPVHVDRRAQDPQRPLRSGHRRRSIRRAPATPAATTAAPTCAIWTSAARFWPRGSAPFIICTITCP